MSGKPKLRIFIAAALLGGAATAHADTVQLRDVAPYRAVESDIYINGGAFHGQVRAYIGSYTVATQAPAESFAAYCVDPFQVSDSSFQTYRRGPLLATDLPVVHSERFAAVSSLYGNAFAGSQENATKAAGFQIALWEVWHDDGVLTTGNIRSVTSSDAGSFAEAQSLLDGIAGWGPGTAYAFTRYSSSSYQDYVTAIPAPPIPEPETHALLLAGLALLGLLMGRRRSGASPVC